MFYSQILGLLFFTAPSSLLESAQTRRWACLSLKRLFVSMVTCLLHLQNCKLGNSIKGLSRQLLLKWCLIVAICFIHLCCPVIFWIWWFCFSQMEEVKWNSMKLVILIVWLGHWALFAGTAVGCHGSTPGWLCDLCSPYPPLHWTPEAEPSNRAELLGDAPWGQLEKKQKLALLSKMTSIVNGFQVLSMRFWYRHVELIISLLWKQL